MPPPGSMYSGAPGGSGAKPPTASGPPGGPPTSREAGPPGGPPGPHPAQRPPSGYPGPYGGPPGPRPPGPMYPGKNLENHFPLKQLRCCCRKRKQRGWWGVHCPCLSSRCTRQGRSSPYPRATAPTRLRASHHTPTIDSVATSHMMPTISCCRPFCSLIGNVKLLVR